MSVPLREQACEGMWRLPLSGLSSPGGACVLALNVFVVACGRPWATFGTFVVFWRELDVVVPATPFAERALVAVCDLPACPASCEVVILVHGWVHVCSVVAR